MKSGTMDRNPVAANRNSCYNYRKRNMKWSNFKQFGSSFISEHCGSSVPIGTLDLLLV
jgi:hypothetical protein